MGIFDELRFDSGSFDVDSMYGYELDAILEASKTAPHSYAVVLSSRNLALVNYDMSIKSDRIAYQMAVTLALGDDSLALNESVMDTIIWSYAAELERVNVALQTVALRKDLKNVSGAVLDNDWGNVLDLKRRTGESDASYKLRLLTRISILTSSGTEPNCRAIIEAIINRTDAVELITYWPAELLVKWTSVEAMKLAEAKWDILKDALDAMVPAGVTWFSFFPYIDYSMGALLGGSVRVDYDIGTLIETRKMAKHIMDASIALHGSVTSDYDIITEITTKKSYVMGMNRPWATRTVSSRHSVISAKTNLVTWDIGVDVLKNRVLDHRIDMIGEKTIFVGQWFSSIVQRSFKRRFQMDVSIT